MAARRFWMPVLCVVALAATDTTARYMRRHNPQRVNPSSGAAEQPLRFLSEPFLVLPFSAQDLDGQDISSEAWRGKVTIVNFWATWCLPCRKEIPALAALQEKYRGQLRVVGVLQDDASVPMVRAFAASFRINYPIVRSTSAIEGSFRETLVLPTTYVVDTEGRVVSVHVGLIDPALLEREIDALIARTLQQGRATG